MNSNNNNLLEFGGTGDLIASAICDFDLNGLAIMSGNVVLNLENIGVRFHYGLKNSNIKSSRTQVDYNEYYLDSFSIDMAPFNLQAQKLFSKMTESNFTVVGHEVATSMANTLLLANGTEDLESIYIPNITEFTKEVINDVVVLKSEQFINQKSYDVYYNRTLQGNVLELDNKDMDIPYLKVQILFKGNSDKKDMINYFIVDKASLRLTPVFNLTNNSVSHIQLFFKVIDSEQKPKMSVMINGQ
jgi:hypothetical protein